MAIQLISIAFNHDPDAAANDAMNIRANRETTVDLPEWSRGAISPSPAAYSIAQTRGQTISIEVSLRGSPGDSAFVRAVSLDQSFSNRLAEVRPRRVDFGAVGEIVTGLFELENVRLEEVGVNAYDVRWRWQHGPTADGPWTPFDEDESQHRIYAVLQLPEHRRPWSRGPLGSTQLPWAEVLEFACQWARGAQTTEDAATLVTQEVYALGRTVVSIPGEEPGPLLQYDGAAHYANVPKFFCTAFLLRLRQKVSKGPWVSCDDCSCIVSTFANVLGCRLAQAWLGDDTPGFNLNPVLLIGAAPGEWEPTHFQHHAVAWAGASGVDDEVFDACLLVDGDDNPTAGSASHVELLPANLRFGRAGERFYQWRLARHTFADQQNSAPVGNITHRRVE